MPLRFSLDCPSWMPFRHFFFKLIKMYWVNSILAFHFQVRRDIAEISLKLAVNPNQSINQSINLVSMYYCMRWDCEHVLLYAVGLWVCITVCGEIVSMYYCMWWDCEYVLLYAVGLWVCITVCGGIVSITRLHYHALFLIIIDVIFVIVLSLVIIIDNTQWY
jgi:hypothetical protein